MRARQWRVLWRCVDWTSFAGGFSVVAPEFSDANGWNVDRYYLSLYLVDVNHDGNADICVRAGTGIYCDVSISSDTNTAFSPIAQQVNNFGDNYGWGSSEAYWSTVQPAGQRFCGRGGAGIVCSARPA